MRYTIEIKQGWILRRPYIEWRTNSLLHRLDGPAWELEIGDREWWKNGSIHRLDGPAREFSDGTKRWWIDNKEYCEKIFKRK